MITPLQDSVHDKHERNRLTEQGTQGIYRAMFHKTATQAFYYGFFYCTGICP
jgi:hypothetical protein